MLMTALELVQEAARRLNIMLPNTIEQPDDPDTNAIDYDSNMLVSALNGTLRQHMHLNDFTQQILVGEIGLEAIEFVLNNYNDPDSEQADYVDMIINLDVALPDFEKLVGDSLNIVHGVVVSDDKGTSKSSSTFCVKNSYAFRQLTDTDFVSLFKRITAVKTSIKTKVADKVSLFVDALDNFYSKKNKDFPSQDQSKLIDSSKRASGFYPLSLDGSRQIYICNNIIKWSDISAQSPINVRFLYRSNYAVKDADGKMQPTFSHDDDTCTLSDELLIVGTIILYKSYQSLDFSLELGQQKALVDIIKQNQQNPQYIDFEKKNMKN